MFSPYMKPMTTTANPMALETHQKQLERLNAVFLEVVAHIYLAPYANETFEGMSGAQQKILFGLSRFGPQKMSDIARQVGLTMSGATGMVNRLVKASLVERQGCPNDRRIILVVLTTAGRKAVKELSSIHEQRMQEVLEGLPADQRDELVASFERIHQILQASPVISEQKV